MNKIIVKLKGGLGNQLFQYAFGKNLAIKTNNSLLIDKSIYAHYKLHAYSLAPFNIDESFVQQDEIPFQYKINNKLFRKSFEFLDQYLYNGQIVKEKRLSFDSTVFDLNFNKTIYLDGYWQSEKYFIENADQIKKSFRLKDEITEIYYLELLGDIETNQSVSIHIRRGSYLLPQYNKTHGLTTMDFYDMAIDYIKQKINNPKFYIFSDDYGFVIEKFKNLQNSVIVKSSVDKDYLDLHLMSKCKHNIIANSSYSWWSAWLNSFSNKIILSPQKWYLDVEKNNQTVDLIPESWMRI